MTYSIEILPEVEEKLTALPLKIRRQISRKIDSLANNPRPPGGKKLKAAGELYRVRSGDYRIIYRIIGDILLVLVVRVAHRRDVYRRLPGTGKV